MRKISIKTKLIGAFSVVTLVAISLVGSGAILGISRVLEQKIEQEILWFAESQESQIFGHFNVLKSRTVDFTSDEFIRDRLRDISENKPGASDALNNHLVKNKKSLDSSIAGIIVTDIFGKVVAATDEKELGEDESADEYILRGRAGVFLTDLIGEEHFGVKKVFAVSAPVTERDTGKLLGVLVNFFDIKYLRDILSGKAHEEQGRISFDLGMEENLATYFVNRNKDVLVNFRQGGEVSVSRINTVAVQKCLANKEEISGQYVNHLGVKVFGASMCLPDADLTLLTEIDSDVAFAPVRNIEISLIIMLLIVGVFIIIQLYSITNSFIKPVEKLRFGAERIVGGDLDSDISITVRDEIGVLAGAFNRMRISLKDSFEKLRQYSKELEGIVAERTQELQGKVNVLNKMREVILNVAEDADNERRKVARERDKINAIIHSIGDGVFVVDNDLRIILINEVAAKMAGYKSDEILGSKYSEKLKFVFEDTGEVNSRFIDNAFASKKVQEMSNHTVLIDKSGNKTQVADSSAPLLDERGNVLGCVVVFRDVTKERAIDKVKTEFVSLASHQLSTPLSTIGWYLEMLLSGDAGKITAKQKQYLDQIQESSKNMTDLIETLLNVSRLELGTFAIEPAPTNVADTVNSVIEEQAPQIKEKKIKLSFEAAEGLPLINADPKLLRIIIQNLVSNAIKYTPPEGGIDIDVSKDETDENIVFRVIDTGYGIPKSQQDKMFSKLFRADNIKTLNIGGTGLGLYIVKSILDNSGGKIWFESEEGRGSTFYVSIPLSGMQKKGGDKSLN